MISMRELAQTVSTTRRKSLMRFYLCFCFQRVSQVRRTEAEGENVRLRAANAALEEDH